eukprot:gene12260-14370_t
MSGLAGGIGETKPADNYAHLAVQAVTPQLMKQTHYIYSNFFPVSYASQVVAGTMYYIKCKVPSGYIHVKIFADLQGHYTLKGVQEGKTLRSPITGF